MKEALTIGIKKGFSGFIWMLKILVPISFLTFLLDYSGWIDKMDVILAPIMSVISLPPMAALPIIIGLLTGIYGAVAAMMVLPFSMDQMTLIAIFLLISHNMIVEGAIQGKSGINPIKATLFRLMASVVTVIIVAWFLDTETAVNGIQKSTANSGASFVSLLKIWGVETAYLCVKIFFIIMTVMILIEIMKHYNLSQQLLKAVNPVLKAMGLDKNVGMLWLTAGMFGIAYGGAVIVEEAKENNFTDKELSKLHLSIGINHAMIEDPSLFLPLGINAFWLWIPRVITAVVAVHLMNLWYKVTPNRSGQPSRTRELGS